MSDSEAEIKDQSHSFSTMLTFSSQYTSQIRFMLQSLDDNNSDSIFQELCKFASNGVGESIMLLKTCMDHLDICGMDLKNMKLQPLYAKIFKHILDKPNFSTVFCESLRTVEINEEFLQNLSGSLDLSASEKIGFGLALSDSEELEIRTCGKNFCIGQIVELCDNPMALDSISIVQYILMFLNHSEGLSKYVDKFMQMMDLVQLKEQDPFILSPFLCDDLNKDYVFRHLDLLSEGAEDDFDAILAEMEKETNMADVMNELGYGCTVNIPHCTEMLSLFLPLSDVTVAKILGTITRTYAGLDQNQSVFSTFHSAFFGDSGLDIPALSSWNVHVLVDSIKQLAPGINWINVMDLLDQEGFYIPNDSAFFFFMSVYKYACQDPFPLHAICSFVWKNVEGQLSFLKHAVSSSPEVFTFAHSERQLTCNDMLNGQEFQPNQVNYAWSCLDLLEVLCQLAERGHASFVQAILETPLTDCPEVLVLGMAHVNTAYNLIQYEVASTVLPMVLNCATGSSLIHKLWHAKPSLTMRGFIHATKSDPENIVRILDACQELEILSSVLDKSPLHFGVRLAALASRKGLLDLENWLSTNFGTYKDSILEECIKFLKEIGAQDIPTNGFPAAALVKTYLDVAPIFLKFLQSQDGVISARNLYEETENLRTLFHEKSRIKDGRSSDSTASDSYADDIEAEANSYFHQMFSGHYTMDGMIKLLARFKESSEKREQSIFDCMISNLFEEYKFFSKYPERQLIIAAVLFGSIIKHQLVTHLTLGIALRCVLDALRKPADSKMFAFGTKALEQFVDRIIEWPQYCNHILQISHLRATHGDLVASIDSILARISAAHTESDAVPTATSDQHHFIVQPPTPNMEVSGLSISLNRPVSPQIGMQTSSQVQPPQRLISSMDERKASASPLPKYMKSAQSSIEQSSIGPPSDTANVQKSYTAVVLPSIQASTPGFPRSSRGFGSALNIETLEAAAERRETPIEAPATDIQDKISFIINNLAGPNIEVKAKEFSEIMNERYYPWFAQYMVMKRASIEPNFHDSYMKFLDKVNSKPLQKEIVKATYENCKVLLRSELIKSSVEERSLLKSLGSWLGKITIGKNQVLRAKEIDPKSLIIQAYERGLMIAVIPFTSKILESCSTSLAYQPPNPWTMAVLALLAEIYAMPNLKMNLKFDIEVLFKNLSVDLKEVPPSSLLVDRVREVEGNPDFSNKDVSLQPAAVNEVKSGMASTRNQVEQSLDAVNVRAGGHQRILSQYAPHISPGMLADDGKMGTLVFSDQPPSQGSIPGQLPFSVNQKSVSETNIELQVVVNDKLHEWGFHKRFQSVLPTAMKRAVTEIVSGIVQRSVSIATQTTKELALKDYAMEPDETLIRNAAHLMVARLAGSLAHVTCKEPLRGSISSQLRNLLPSLTPSSELLEAVQLVTNDNLDLGCVLIEKAATDKAIQTIDGEIAQQLSIRRKHRENFFEASVYAHQISGLPEELRPKPGQLSVSQQRVYEDFARFPGQQWLNQSSNDVSVGPSPSSVSVGSSRQNSLASGPIGAAIYSSGLMDTGIEAVSQTLDICAKEMDTDQSQIASGSLTYLAAGDGPSAQILENAAVGIPPTLSCELQGMEPSSSVKESGNVQQSITSTQPSGHIGSNSSEQLLTTGDALDKYQTISEKLETLLANNADEAEIQGVIAEVPAVILNCISRDEAALAVAQKAFKYLCKKVSNSDHVSAHIGILAAIRDVSNLVVKELTSWVMYSEDDRKFNKDIIVGLIRNDVLNLAEYDVHMARLIDAGQNKAATEFAITLIQTLVVNDSKVISELHNLVDALAKIAGRPGSPESLQQLVGIAKNPATDAAMLSTATRDNKATGIPGASRDIYTATEMMDSDPVGLHDQVSELFAEWYQICELPGANDAAYARFVLQLQQRGLLKGDEITNRFFRRIMELSVAHCLSSEVINSSSAQPHQGQPLSFLAIDIYAKLVFSVLKFCPADQGSSKLALLPKVLSVTVKYIQKDADEKRTSFNPRPYFRLFVNWLLDLCSLDPVTDGANFLVLTALANSFHAVQPLKVPGFSFAWLELVGSRSFMPKLLTVSAQKGWPFFQRLLLDLFQFMEPFLRNAELGEHVHFLYKGTLRVLLVLLHDFPEFLCDYHFSFCDMIPPSCIQMRNIILSAFPRNMRLPDPSTPNLKIDLLPEMHHSPRILSEIEAILKAKQIKSDVDQYVETRQQVAFLSELKQKLLLSPNDAAHAGTRYNVPLLNSLVLNVVIQSIVQLQERAPQPQSMAASMNPFLVGAALDIFQRLILDLDTEGRYLLLNAIANHLRYPNYHTHYFSFIILYLFSESNQETIQEQITRVLLERLIVNRPHPWGLLVTFMELIKNPRYNFWSRSFTRCAPEIEKLFESVSRSCGGPKPVEESVVSGGIPDAMH